MNGITVTMHSREYVLEQCHISKTNGLGKTQRSILAFLETAPAGFGTIATDGATITDHGLPYGVTVAEVTRAVYATSEPTPGQLRTVQRGIRRLADLGLVDCRHGVLEWSQRRHMDYRGEMATGPRPVSGLWVALRWDCAHLAEQQRRAEEEEQCAQAVYEARMAWFKGEPIEALQSIIGGGW